jgi:excinuclease ABC subunit A
VTIHSSRRASPARGRGFAEPDPRLLSFNSPQGWCPECHGTGTTQSDYTAEQTGEESQWLATDAASASPCPACEGARLNPIARHLRLDGRSISALTTLTVDALGKFCDRLRLDARGTAIALDAMAEIRSRLRFSRAWAGVPVSGSRRATLSGGGRSASTGRATGLQPAGGLLTYEPTIGLHPRDNAVLLKALDALAGARNT